jgi:hypothetical protein
MKQVLIAIFALLAVGVSAQDSTATQAKAKKNPIKEIKIWYNGQQFDADDLDVLCVEDDFETFANFRWSLMDSTTRILAQGYLIMKGDDYVDYLTKPNHGQKAVRWVMAQLNLQAGVQRRQQPQ